MRLSESQVWQFQKTVYAYFDRSGRTRLPWRRARRTPYHIFISEIMLQQTQVDRVVEKFELFIRTFKNFQSLAAAPFSSVLAVWHGLGYNRRARYVHQAAQTIVRDHRGRLPADPEILATLPGIGRATAASICAFAFSMSIVFIETNIRSVFIHHFFHDRKNVPDTAIEPLVAATLDRHDPYRWYSALMDYGVYLKKTVANPSRKSTHYVKQSRFEGSARQVRGRIIKRLLEEGPAMTRVIQKACNDDTRVAGILEQLKDEGLIVMKKTRWTIA